MCTFYLDNVTGTAKEGTKISSLFQLSNLRTRSGAFRNPYLMFNKDKVL